MTGRKSRQAAHNRRAAGELENDVLETLRALGEPATPRAVHDAISADLAYNTLHTILVRLVEKGLLARAPSGRAHLYWLADAPEERAVEQMHALLGRGPDHESVLARFVSSLSVEDERTLRAMLGTRPR